MTDEQTPALRAIIIDALAAALEPLQAGIRELQADVAHALDTLDTLGVDMQDVKAKLEALSADVRDVKAHNAKTSREGIKDRTARQDSGRRLSALERRLESLERKP